MTSKANKADNLDALAEGAIFAVPVPEGRVRIKMGAPVAGREGRIIFLQHFDPRPFGLARDGWETVTSWTVVAGKGRPRVERRNTAFGYYEVVINATRESLPSLAARAWADRLAVLERAAARKAAREADLARRIAAPA